MRLGGAAACQTDGHTEYEDLGFSIMDLVKHAVKTVIKAMRQQDRISIILFDDKVQVPYTFVSLTHQKREELVGFVDQIRHRGSTNIFDAIHKGMELIMNRPAECTNEAAIMFFTDGQPNCGKYSTASGIITGLETEKANMKFKYPIHTYAFGQYTACTSSLLLSIANNFDGMFGYIQDAKTLGTIFINGLAYTLTNAATSVYLMVSLDGKNILPTS